MQNNVQVILGFSSTLVCNHRSQIKGCSAIPAVLYNQKGKGEFAFRYEMEMECIPAVFVKDPARMDSKVFEKVGRIRGTVQFDMNVEVHPGQEGKSWAEVILIDHKNVVKNICREVGRDRCTVAVEVKYLNKVISFKGLFEDEGEVGLGSTSDFDIVYLPAETLMELMSHKIKQDSFRAHVCLEFDQE